MVRVVFQEEMQVVVEEVEMVELVVLVDKEELAQQVFLRL